MSELVPADGFGDDSGSDRLLQGSRVHCVDGDWTFAKDDSAVPEDLRFLVLGTAEAQQHWQDGQLVEERIKKSGTQLSKPSTSSTPKFRKRIGRRGRTDHVRRGRTSTPFICSIRPTAPFTRR
jgi:hypothetical protein